MSLLHDVLKLQFVTKRNMPSSVFHRPVIIELPHFASLRGREREIVVLRSDSGENWREHTLEATEEAIKEALDGGMEGEEIESTEELQQKRIVRILTTDFPQYFAVVTRVRMETKMVGPEGGMLSSSVVPQVQAVFPEGALTKKIRVGLQAQPVKPELVKKMYGNRVLVSPIVTVEPRRRKFHKPITMTIPLPSAAAHGIVNGYGGGDTPTLRLLCSITEGRQQPYGGSQGGPNPAQWEDITGSTPLTFVNDCVSFTTTVSARFWLMDCRQINESVNYATQLYREVIAVPFMAKFVVFAKTQDPVEARLRVFCMTDDKYDKTLEKQEHFTEIARSRDVEVLEGKTVHIESAGNLIPLHKSGEQLHLNFYAFRENRLPFLVKVKDSSQEPTGRLSFMPEPKTAKSIPPPPAICNLNVTLPEHKRDSLDLDALEPIQVVDAKVQEEVERTIAEAERAGQADRKEGVPSPVKETEVVTLETVTVTNLLKEAPSPPEETIVTVASPEREAPDLVEEPKTDVNLDEVVDNRQSGADFFQALEEEDKPVVEEPPREVPTEEMLHVDASRSSSVFAEPPTPDRTTSFDTTSDVTPAKSPEEEEAPPVAEVSINAVESPPASPISDGPVEEVPEVTPPQVVSPEAPEPYTQITEEVGPISEHITVTTEVGPEGEVKTITTTQRREEKVIVETVGEVSPEKPATADEPSLGWVEGGEVEVVRRREKAPSPEGSPERLTEKRISREVETFLKRTSFQEFEDEPLVIPGVDVPADAGAETKPEIAPTDTQPAASVEVSRVEESRKVEVDAGELTPSEQATPQKELPSEVMVEKQEGEVTPTPAEPPMLTPTEKLPVTDQVEITEEITVKAATVESTDKTVPDNQLAEKVEEVKEVIKEPDVTPTEVPSEAPVSQKVEEVQVEGETVKLREKPKTEEPGSPDRLTEKRISREIETFLKRTSFQEFEDEPLVIPGLDEPAGDEAKSKPEIVPTEVVAPPEPKESVEGRETTEELPQVTQELKEVSKPIDETPKTTPTEELPIEDLINEQVVEVREDVVQQSLPEVAPVVVEQPGSAQPAEEKELDEVKTEDLMAKQVEEVREDVKVAQPGPAVPEQVTPASKEVIEVEEPVKLREKPQTVGSPELTEKRISLIPGVDDVTISGVEAKVETAPEEVKVVAPEPPVQKVEEPSEKILVPGEAKIVEPTPPEPVKETVSKEIEEPTPPEPVKETVSKEEIKREVVKDVKEPEVDVKVKEIPQEEPAVTEPVITKEVKEEVVSKPEPEIEVVKLREKRKTAESPEGLTEKRISREVETFLKRTSFQEFEDEPLVIPGLDQPEDKVESKPEISVPTPKADLEVQPEAVSPPVTQPDVDRKETVEVQPIPADSKVVHVVEPKETVEETVTEEQIVTDDGVVTRIVKTTRTEVVTGSSTVVEEKPIVIEKFVSDKPTVSEGEVGIVVKPSEEQPQVPQAEVPAGVAPPGEEERVILRQKPDKDSPLTEKRISTEIEQFFKRTSFVEFEPDEPVVSAEEVPGVSAVTPTEPVDKEQVSEVRAHAEPEEEAIVPAIVEAEKMLGRPLSSDEKATILQAAHATKRPLSIDEVKTLVETVDNFGRPLTPDETGKVLEAIKVAGRSLQPEECSAVLQGARTADRPLTPDEISAIVGAYDVVKRPLFDSEISTILQAVKAAERPLTQDEVAAIVEATKTVDRRLSPDETKTILEAAKQTKRTLTRDETASLLAATEASSGPLTPSGVKAIIDAANAAGRPLTPDEATSILKAAEGLGRPLTPKETNALLQAVNSTGRPLTQEEATALVDSTKVIQRPLSTGEMTTLLNASKTAGRPLKPEEISTLLEAAKVAEKPLTPAQAAAILDATHFVGRPLKPEETQAIFEAARVAGQPLSADDAAAIMEGAEQTGRVLHPEEAASLLQGVKLSGRPLTIDEVAALLEAAKCAGRPLTPEEVASILDAVKMTERPLNTNETAAILESTRVIGSRLMPNETATALEAARIAERPLRPDETATVLDATRNQGRPLTRGETVALLEAVKSTGRPLTPEETAAILEAVKSSEKPLSPHETTSILAAAKIARRTLTHDETASLLEAMKATGRPLTPVETAAILNATRAKAGPLSPEETVTVLNASKTLGRPLTPNENAAILQGIKDTGRALNAEEIAAVLNAAKTAGRTLAPEEVTAIVAPQKLKESVVLREKSHLSQKRESVKK
ncbi:Ankyrin-2 [Branchiostoma belcheri]|nr:Ankyrin-2 [Branchiostoma belcheri]